MPGGPFARPPLPRCWWQHLLQISSGSGDDAHVHFQGRRNADAFSAPLALFVLRQSGQAHRLADELGNHFQQAGRPR
jgi:hypothetical protein